LSGDFSTVVGCYELDTHFSSNADCFLLMMPAVVLTVNLYSQLDLSNITTNTATNIYTLIFAVISSGGDCWPGYSGGILDHCHYYIVRI